MSCICNQKKGICVSLTLLNFCDPVRCFLMACLRSSPWSSPWHWRRLPWETPSTSSRYLISRATRRCSSLSVSPLPASRLAASLSCCHYPSLPHSLLPLSLSSSISYLLFITPSVLSFFLSLIPLLRSHPLSHFPLRLILCLDIFSILSPFYSTRLLSSLILLPLPVSLAPCLSVIFCSPLSFTFFVIHVRSMMKHWSPSESP